MKRVLSTAVAILWVGLSFMVCAGIASAGNKETVALTAEQTVGRTLTASAPVVEEPFEVDQTPRVTFEVVSDTMDLLVSLITPTGNVIDPSNAVNAGVDFLQYQEGAAGRYEQEASDFAVPAFSVLPGAHYAFVLSNNPTTGSYRLRITSRTGIEGTVPIIINMRTDSPIRAAIITDKSTYPVNGTVRLSAFVFNGRDPVQGATADASIFPFLTSLQSLTTSVTPATLSLYDDSRDPDAVPNDGVYTAVFRAVEAGRFMATVRIAGEVSGQGRFIRTALVPFTVFEQAGRFLQAFKDTAFDDDHDGKLDRVQVQIQANALRPGRYGITATLAGANGHTVTVSRVDTLAVGIQFVSVDFTVQELRDLGVSGPYSVRDLMLEFFEDGSSGITDRVNGEVFKTQAYQLGDLPRGVIALTGINDASGTDTNQNGKFDVLYTRIGADILSPPVVVEEEEGLASVELAPLTPALFSWSARLVDFEGREIAVAENYATFTNGPQQLTLNFQGSAIGQHAVSGPYVVRDLVVTGSGDSIMVQQVMQTAAFHFTDFEGVTVNDALAPVTTAALSPPANPVGWNKTQAAAILTARDNAGGTGVRTLLYRVGALQTYTTVDGEIAAALFKDDGIGTLDYYAVDNAGNQESSKSLTVRVDQTPPTVTASASPRPNANGWNRTDVTVSFSATDALSGVAQVDAPLVVSTEGFAQLVTGTATDVAGNVGLGSVTLNIDKTLPVLTPVFNPAPNFFGWNKTDVIVSFTATDTLSGVATVNGGKMVKKEGANQAVTGTAADRAGNTGTLIALVNLDRTPPVVTAGQSPLPNKFGWNRTDVAVAFSATDTLSGIAAIDPPRLISTEGKGQVVAGAATDKADNVGLGSLAVNLDKTPPLLSVFQTLPPNQNGWNNTDVTVSFTAMDTLSGVARVAGPATLTSEGGRQAVTGIAIDRADNLASLTALVNLDKTPPEALNQFTPATQDVVLLGRDALSGVPPGPVPVFSVVPTQWSKGESVEEEEDEEKEAAEEQEKEKAPAELRTYKVADLAGNTLLVVEKVKRAGHELKATIVSLQYNQGKVLTLPRNKKAFEWALNKDGSLKELEQKVEVGKGKNKQKAQAKYDGKKNETTLKVKGPGPKPETKLVKPGLVLLQLTTAKGKLGIEWSESSLPQPPSPAAGSLGADLDGNGRVDGRDLMLLARAIGSRPGAPRWLAQADLNGDGVIDRLDLKLLKSQFGRKVVRR